MLAIAWVSAGCTCSIRVHFNSSAMWAIWRVNNSSPFFGFCHIGSLFFSIHFPLLDESGYFLRCLFVFRLGSCCVCGKLSLCSIKVCFECCFSSSHFHGSLAQVSLHLCTYFFMDICSFMGCLVLGFVSGSCFGL